MTTTVETTEGRSRAYCDNGHGWVAGTFSFRQAAEEFAAAHDRWHERMDAAVRSGLKGEP